MIKKIMITSALLLSLNANASAHDYTYYLQQSVVLEGVSRASYLAYKAECDEKSYEVLDDPRKFALSWLSTYSKGMKTLYDQSGDGVFQLKSSAALKAFLIYSNQNDDVSHFLKSNENRIKVDDSFKFELTRQQFRTGKLSCDDASSGYQRLNDIAVTLD